MTKKETNAEEKRFKNINIKIVVNFYNAINQGECLSNDFQMIDRSLSMTIACHNEKMEDNSKDRFCIKPCT